MRYGTVKELVKLSADMPPFLTQDRPKKVKEIYRALKREHPEYSAGKKARIANAMGKEAEVEYRGKKFPGYNQPIDSDRPEKKKMVLAKKGDQVKLIHFGQKGYKHNYSDAAKKNYLTRSAGIRGKDGSLTANDKFSANYWARRELWPKNEPADGSARNREKRASDVSIPEESDYGHKKVAAPRYLKQLRELVESGDIEGAQALASKLDAAGVLKKTEKGSIIKILGSGAEGPAALTVGSTDSPVPLSVMKMFDRKGALYDRSSLAEKFNMLRRARAANNPEIAQLYSPRIRKGSGGTPFYHTEFVHGKNTDFGISPRATPSVYGPGTTEFTRALLLPAGKSFGMGDKKMLGDVIGNSGNTIEGTAGKKIIDFIPSSPQGAQRIISANSPRMKRLQRWFGLPENTTAPTIDVAQGRAQRLVSRLNDPAFAAELERKGAKIGPELQAENMRSLFDIPNVARSDFTEKGLRRADPQRTLRGL